MKFKYLYEPQVSTTRPEFIFNAASLTFQTKRRRKNYIRKTGDIDLIKFLLFFR